MLPGTNLRIIIVLIDNKRDHDPIKKYLDNYGIESQFMFLKNAKIYMKKMGVYTNLLRQINAKVGLDLYRISLPQKLRNTPTMIVGIDVVNTGRDCIVGLAATYN